MDATSVTKALDALNVSYRFFKHPGPVHSVEQAAQQRGMTIDQVIRSIVFRLEQDHFIMVLVPGGRQIAWPALRKYLRRSRLTLASEAEVLQVTGYPLGAVSPFGLPHPMRILADPGVFARLEVSIGAGIRNATIILASDDLRVALGPVEIVPLTS
ncbi:MAG: YbaK/EbsC family protein [Anaerolineaceae bacterium]|nr:YbaK/EbsC family protein [Anaerolineaceae bacterium]